MDVLLVEPESQGQDILMRRVNKTGCSDDAAPRCYINTVALLHIVNHLHQFLTNSIGSLHRLSLTIYAYDRLGV